jgi:hypothetical protein
VTYAMPGRRTLTVGQLRERLEIPPPETPLLVVIRDRHHVNTMLGDLAVTGAAIMPSGSDRALTFDVEKLT